MDATLLKVCRRKVGGDAFSAPMERRGSVYDTADSAPKSRRTVKLRSRSIEARRISRLLAQVIDVTDGTRHLLELAEQDAWALADDQEPLLDCRQHDALRRMAITALLLVSEEAERLGEQFDGAS